MAETNVKDKIATLEMLKKVDDHNLVKDFSELDEVPSGESFSGDDLIAIEIDGVNYKLTGAALAAALKTLGNYVSKTGDSMTGTLSIKNTTNYVNLSLSPNDDCKTDVITTGDNSGSRIRFRTYPTGSSNFEDFVMPFTSSNISTNTPYEILTTKSMSASVQAAARAALGNAAYTIFNNYPQSTVTSNSATDVNIVSTSVALPAGTYLVIAFAYVHQSAGSGRLKFKYGSSSLESVISDGAAGETVGINAVVLGTFTSDGTAQTAAIAINSGSTSNTMTARAYMQYKAIVIRI